MSIEKRFSKIKKEFKGLESWEDKYQKLIEMGRGLPDFPAKDKVDENRVNGCVSQVWLVADYNKKKNVVNFLVDSDAIIVKGLVALVWNLYSDLSPQEILLDDGSFLKEIGLEENLTPNRVNGVYAVIKNMKVYALGFQKLSEMN